MIKGVNKRIIEINNPRSLYFEKAIFYLRPEVREIPAETVRREISRYMDTSGITEAEKRKRRKIRNITMVISVVIIAVALIYVFNN